VNLGHSGADTGEVIDQIYGAQMERARVATSHSVPIGAVSLANSPLSVLPGRA